MPSYTCFCGQTYGKPRGLSVHQSRYCQHPSSKALSRRASSVELSEGEVEVGGNEDHVSSDEAAFPAVHRRIWEDPVLFGPPKIGQTRSSNKRTRAISPDTPGPVPPVASSSATSDAQPLSSAQKPAEPDVKDARSVRIEYHPHSGLRPLVEPFEKFQERVAKRPRVEQNDKPWNPFESRSDFEFAELALEAHLSEQQVNRLIRIIQRLRKHEDTFNLLDNRALEETWRAASAMLTPFEKHTVGVKYKDDPVEYPFFCRDLWQWTLDAVQNPLLAPHFVWDAQKVYQETESTSVRIIDEPWTAERLWEVQSQLPPNGKPLGLIVYADKNLLSSFGTEKGYPVLARIANLPSEIRNSNVAIGGGSVVGWLPVIEEKQSEKKDSAYVELKRVVWHESFRKFLASIKHHSYTGCPVTCGDNIERLLFPFVMILSADYEEQCIMALIRGTNGKCPCPICLVPKAEQYNQKINGYPKRDITATQLLVSNAKSQSKKVAEAHFKKQGIRGIENAFWDIKFSDPFKAISWDRMHSYAHGLGGKHLWPLLQEYVALEGNEAVAKVDKRSELMPRWRGLGHFNIIMGTKFSDANKYEDIVKISLYLTHDILAKNININAHRLIQLLREYLILDVYASMEVHTEKTLEDGKKVLAQYSKAMKQYIKEVDDENLKSWNFPKNHTHVHLFEDILAKGATKNYNTKYNENAHGPLKTSYKLSSNFRDVAHQILYIEHTMYTSRHICSLIDFMDDEEERKKKDALLAIQDKPKEPSSALGSSKWNGPQWFGNIYLGSPQKAYTIGSINKQQAQLLSKLHHFFIDELPVLKIPVPRNIHHQISLSTKITEFRFIKAQYESKVTFLPTTDYLRCSPMHYNHPRYDYIMVNTAEGVIFAQLELVFTVILDDKTYAIALVCAFDRPPPRMVPTHIKRKDKELKFLRLQKSKTTELVWVQSIIRGGVLIPAYDTPDQFVVFDVLDPDMYLRVVDML